MKVQLKPLREQVVVVTGASSGVGLVTARTAAERGAKVAAVARNEDDVRRAAEHAVATFGRFDTWANNAGVSIFGKPWDVPMDDRRRVFDTVYWGVVHGSLAAVRHHRARGAA